MIGGSVQVVENIGWQGYIGTVVAKGPTFVVVRLWTHADRPLIVLDNWQWTAVGMD